MWLFSFLVLPGRRFGDALTGKRFHFRFPHIFLYETSPALVQEINLRACKGRTR